MTLNQAGNTNNGVTGISIFYALLVLPCFHLPGMTLNQAGNTNNGVTARKPGQQHYNREFSTANRISMAVFFTFSLV
jgi:hypothetical protein